MSAFDSMRAQAPSSQRTPVEVGGKPVVEPRISVLPRTVQRLAIFVAVLALAGPGLVQQMHIVFGDLRSHDIGDRRRAHHDDAVELQASSPARRKAACQSLPQQSRRRGS